ncbi:hypothetical protein [Mesorhizobium sp. M8A.F.Ca.ET.021.01.1.1]|uniref:hypothetical protein n=1 Tax=Mesorhizobium sp. M8A.F.Ca.ET.021.01.1.1 TaxID=2496757 RepID=UPI000FCB7C6F|nr:hypothetical protein [Mesorhizobium sp. M8A.F.Ca.ET.021.01.1.1]RUW56715.1 hypothetical protein EOA36_02710 [Mesorhizobium sp. M8A.F.Ca.ET.021.01.1.1]
MTAAALLQRFHDALMPHMKKVLIAEVIFVVAFAAFAYLGMPWGGLGCVVAYLGFIAWCLTR